MLLMSLTGLTMFGLNENDVAFTFNIEFCMCFNVLIINSLIKTALYVGNLLFLFTSCNFCTRHSVSRVYSSFVSLSVGWII